MSRTALWKDIESTLMRDIAHGHYNPGDKLPTEAEMARRFGVNRHTVRRALAALAEQNLIYSRRGAGVFVASRPTEYPIGQRTRFHANLQAAGRSARKIFLRTETRPADPREAERLHLTSGDIIHLIEGVGLSDDQPLNLFTSIFPGPLNDFIETVLETHSITKGMIASGIPDYTRLETRITAENASATQAAHLKCRPGDALLRTEAVNVAPSGRIVEYGRSWFVGERVKLMVAAN